MTSIKSPQFDSKKLEALKRILKRDYEIDLSDEEAEGFGLSLLRITRMAIGAFNREEEKRAMAIIH